MTFDKCISTNSAELTLMAHEEAETEERRALDSMRPRLVDPRLEATIDIELLAVQRGLEFSRMKRVLSITPQEFGQLSGVERRNLLRAAQGFFKRFDEISAWMGRNSPALPELPQYLRERGAA